MRRARNVDGAAGWFPPGGWITPAGKFVPGGRLAGPEARRRRARPAGRGGEKAEREEVGPAAAPAAAPEERGRAEEGKPEGEPAATAAPPRLMGGGGPHAASPAPRPRTLAEAGELARRTLQS